jgi:hypothetical protein
MHSCKLSMTRVLAYGCLRLPLGLVWACCKLNMTLPAYGCLRLPLGLVWAWPPMGVFFGYTQACEETQLRVGTVAGQQLANSWPTAGQQLANSWPTAGQQLAKAATQLTRGWPLHHTTRP